MAVLMVTVNEEGGYYSPRKDTRAPIRIYSDRRVADDICTLRVGKKWRQTLTRKEYRRIRKAAAENLAKGVV